MTDVVLHMKLSLLDSAMSPVASFYKPHDLIGRMTYPDQGSVWSLRMPMEQYRFQTLGGAVIEGSSWLIKKQRLRGQLQGTNHLKNLSFPS